MLPSYAREPSTILVILGGMEGTLGDMLSYQ
jgi:hypothetical protein